MADNHSLSLRLISIQIYLSNWHGKTCWTFWSPTRKQNQTPPKLFLHVFQEQILLFIMTHSSLQRVFCGSCLTFAWWQLNTEKWSIALNSSEHLLHKSGNMICRYHMQFLPLPQEPGIRSSPSELPQQFWWALQHQSRKLDQKRWAAACPLRTTAEAWTVLSEAACSRVFCVLRRRGLSEKKTDKKQRRRKPQTGRAGQEQHTPPSHSIQCGLKALTSSTLAAIGAISKRHVHMHGACMWYDFMSCQGSSELKPRRKKASQSGYEGKLTGSYHVSI